MIPDAEAVLTAYLSPALAGLGVDIVPGTPADTSEPWVRLTLLDAPSEGSQADHLVAAYVQLDCYAGGGDDGQAEVNLIGRTVREALRTIAAADHDGAVVNGSRIVGYARIPDGAFEPARERVVVTATIWVHA